MIRPLDGLCALILCGEPSAHVRFGFGLHLGSGVAVSGHTLWGYSTALRLGKADFSTVGQRLACPYKDTICEFLDEELGGLDACTALLGEIALPPGMRLSQELLSDVESLLILHEQPLGNYQCRKSPIGRPGMRVACLGEWPGQPLYVD